MFFRLMTFDAFLQLIWLIFITTMFCFVFSCPFCLTFLNQFCPFFASDVTTLANESHICAIACICTFTNVSYLCHFNVSHIELKIEEKKEKQRLLEAQAETNHMLLIH